MKPFNLESALAGAPVVLRNGDKAYIRHHETAVPLNHPLLGIVEGQHRAASTAWSLEGEWRENTVDELDIVGMWEEPLTFDHWDILNTAIKYIAKDRDERWWGYKERPYKRMDEEEWAGGQSAVMLTDVLASLFPDCDWRNSLIERP